jgi:uncharacterized protein
MSFWPSWNENKLFTFLTALILIILILFFGFKTLNTIKENKVVGVSDTAQHTVMMEGVGSVDAKPDIAVLTFGMMAEDDSVSKAQEFNTKGMNAIIKSIKEVGIDEKDLQTIDYSAYEKKDWDPDTRTYKSGAWVVSQNLKVKVRDVQKVSGVIDAAVKTGVTSVNGPNFQIDDADALEEEARDLALEDAKAKAQAVADKLGVKIEKVIGYTEWKENDGPGPIYAYETLGVGGAAKSAPDIQAGTKDVTMHVTVTYSLSN